MLMTSLCNLADKKDDIVYFEASSESVSVYRKFGFQEVDRIQVDIQGKPYVNLCMIRKPQLKTE